MKTLNKLALLILIFLKSTPEIFRVYQQIYRNVINQQEELRNRTKQMIEADKVIKTTFIHEQREYPEKIKQRLKRQRAKLERFNNG